MGGKCMPWEKYPRIFCSFQVTYTNVQLVLVIFLIGSLVSSIIVLPLAGFRVGRIYGIFLCVYYVVFLAVAILTELGVIINTNTWKQFIFTTSGPIFPQYCHIGRCLISSFEGYKGALETMLHAIRCWFISLLGRGNCLQLWVYGQILSWSLAAGKLLLITVYI